jgi:hypothetical protein
VVDVAGIEIPDGLDPVAEAEARSLLGHLKHGVVRLDEAIQSAADWPPSDPGRGGRALTEAQIVLEDLRCLEKLGSILPPNFLSCWMEETNDRLRPLGVLRPIDSPPTPPTPRPIRAVRPFSLRRPSFDPSNEAAIYDYVIELVKKANDTFMNLMPRIAFAVGGDLGVLAEALAQALHDEAHVGLEVERADQRLDRCTYLSYRLREHPGVKSALELVGVELALDATSLTSRERWEPLALNERAWAVNNLVLDAIAAAPERAGTIKARDVTLAVNGDYRAWERLRAACLSGDEREQQAAAQTTEHAHSARKTPEVSRGSEAPTSRGTTQTKRVGSPVWSDQQFRQRLINAGRRLLTGDTSGHLSDEDKALIRKNRRLTRTAVCGLLGIHRSTLPSYLKTSRMDWDTWKEEMERRYLQQGDATA